MLAIFRSAVLLLGLGLAACASTPLPAQPTAAADRHGERCAVDAECPGGSCRAGSCSWAAPEEPVRPQICIVETCYGGAACRTAAPCEAPTSAFLPRRR